MAEYSLHPEVSNQAVRRLTVSVRLKLAELLDEVKISCVENDLPRDYRGLALLAGLTASEIEKLQKEEQPTDQVLTQWCRIDPGCTVAKLIDHLQKLRCYYVLDEVIPMLASSYEPVSPEIIEILPRQWWNSKDQPLGNLLPAILGLVFLEHTGRAEDVDEPLDNVMRRLQTNNVAMHGYRDIDCNFVISPDGRIVEGTGWHLGDTPPRYNHMAVSIALLGDYNEERPDARMMAAVQHLLQDLLRQGKLERDFALYGVCDVAPSTSPGSHVMEAINSWACFRRKGMLQQDWQIDNAGF